jgi:hypothetical protein
MFKSDIFKLIPWLRTSFPTGEGGGGSDFFVCMKEVLKAYLMALYATSQLVNFYFHLHVNGQIIEHISDGK